MCVSSRCFLICFFNGDVCRWYPDEKEWTVIDFGGKPGGGLRVEGLLMIPTLIPVDTLPFIVFRQIVERLFELSSTQGVTMGSSRPLLGIIGVVKSSIVLNGLNIGVNLYVVYERIACALVVNNARARETRQSL